MKKSIFFTLCFLSFAACNSSVPTLLSIESAPKEKETSLDASIEKETLPEPERLFQEAMIEQPKEKENVEKVPFVCATDTSLAETKVGHWEEILLNQTHQRFTLDSCSAKGFRFVAPKGMQLRIEIQSLKSSSLFQAALLHPRRIHYQKTENALVEGGNEQKTWIVLEKELPQSGEYYLTVDSRQNPQQEMVELAVTCMKNCHLLATRFPVALVHGFAGTDQYFGVLDYFYKVKPHLEKNGFSILTPKVQPVASSTSRIVPLQKQLDEFLLQTGARKLNLIAHSQGGLDCRHLISIKGYGQKIASLTTVATPHYGMPIPPVDFIPLVDEMSEKTMKDFNQKYPNDPNVWYFSWSAASCGFLDFDCQKKRDGEIHDVLVLASYNFLKLVSGDNDGIVPTKSMVWGNHLGTLNADHWDQIGQVADSNNKPFQHLDFYLDEMKRLITAQF